VYTRATEKEDYKLWSI